MLHPGGEEKALEPWGRGYSPLKDLASGTVWSVRKSPCGFPVGCHLTVFSHPPKRLACAAVQTAPPCHWSL